MRYELWLAQPKMEGVLRASLRTAGALFAVWALAVAFLLWSTRSTLNRQQAALAARSQQMSALAGGMAGKRADALHARRVRTSSPEGPGSAEFTGELTALAETAGADVSGVQIGGTSAPNSPPRGAAPATAGTNPVPTEIASAADWKQESFECNVQGHYASLSRFLDGLAASRRVLEFRSVQIMPAAEPAGATNPRLQLKVTGVVYGLAETP